MALTSEQADKQKQDRIDDLRRMYESINDPKKHAEYRRAANVKKRQQMKRNDAGLP